MATLGVFELGGLEVVDVVGTVTPVAISLNVRSGLVTVGLRRPMITVAVRADRLSVALRDLVVALDARSGRVESDFEEALVLAG